METIVVIRVMSLSIRLIVLLLCLLAWRKRPQARLWIIAPATWALHGLLYYICLVSGAEIAPQLLTMWASVLGLHAGFLILAGAWLFLWPAKGWRR